ncbi:MAG: phosphoserine phosphatase SerB [Pseudomonadales bacterium]|jgi:phosphoserine phosphatase
MATLVLINITGEDKPGLTAAITALLGEFDVDILDVGQAVIHNYLTLGILTSVPGESDKLFKEILFNAHALGVTVKFSPVDDASYDQWVKLQGRSRFILTLLARKVRAVHLARVSKVIAQHHLNIDNITRLSGRVPLAHESPSTKACVEFSLRGEPGETFRRDLMEIGAEMDIDIAVQEDGIFRRNRRLVAFDMDSTLIDTEVIDELARCAGVGEKVSAVTRRAMNGELDFKASLIERVLLLKGLEESALEEVASRLPIMEGAEQLISTLKRLGYKTAVLSGGFTYFGKVLQQKLGLDYVFANDLEIIDGRLTGRVLEPIVDAARKAELLQQLAAQEEISMEQTIAVGDGANDLAMLGVAGLGIAFHAKPLVKESAEHSISTLGLDSILYLMGIRDRENRQS